LAMNLSEDAHQILGETPMPTDEVSSATRRTGGTLASPIRETALLLMAWLDADRDAAQIPALVERLHKLAIGTADGHWGTTQDNAFVLMALGRYAQTLETAEPVRGTVTIGGTDHQFSTSEPLRLSRADLAGAKITVTPNR